MVCTYHTHTCWGCNHELKDYNYWDPEQYCLGHHIGNAHPCPIRTTKSAILLGPCCRLTGGQSSTAPPESSAAGTQRRDGKVAIPRIQGHDYRMPAATRGLRTAAREQEAEDRHCVECTVSLAGETNISLGMCHKCYHQNYTKNKKTTEECAFCGFTESSVFNNAPHRRRCGNCKTRGNTERKRDADHGRKPRLVTDWCKLCDKKVTSEFSGRPGEKNRICAECKALRPNPTAPYGEPFQTEEQLRQNRQHSFITYQAANLEGGDRHSDRTPHQSGSQSSLAPTVPQYEQPQGHLGQYHVPAGQNAPIDSHGNPTYTPYMVPNQVTSQIPPIAFHGNPTHTPYMAPNEPTAYEQP
jgi:hypothetical protein